MTDIDVIEPRQYATDGIPHEQLRWLRRTEPVFWHPDPHDGVPGFWAVTRHADVSYVSRTPELFSVARRGAMFVEFDEPTLDVQRGMLMNMDPPDHTTIRRFVSHAFTPRRIGRLEERVRAVCAELVDAVREQESVDFMTSLAAPLPAHFICELLGAPPEDQAALFALANRLTGFDDAEVGVSLSDAELAGAEMYGYIQSLIEFRRRKPDGGIVSALAEAAVQSAELSDDTCVRLILQLAVAGNETTRNATAGGMLALFEHPDQWRRLQDDRRLLDTLADEIVRWVSPINQFRRTATRESVLSGTRIGEGDKVVVFYSSANFDEEVFAEPYRFDVGRSPNPHLGFGGGGPHFCMGSHLARIQLQAFFGTLLDRLPGIRPAGEVRRLCSNFINGVKELPVSGLHG